MNKTKTCAGCKETKDTSEFFSKVKYCKPCNNLKTAAHRKLKAADKKAIVDSYKVLCGCKICRFDESAVALDFHHLDPADKVHPVATMVNRCWSWDLIKTEIRKCVVVCSNCHRRLHAGEVELPK